MKRKLKLDINLSSEYKLIGISCPKSDYWLAFQLNKSLDFKLTRKDDFVSLCIDQSTNVSFSFFEFYEDIIGVKYFLISNSNLENRLFSQLKTIDYFMIIKNEGVNIDIGKTITAIRNIKGVLLANIVDTSKINNFNVFLLDLEMIQ